MQEVTRWRIVTVQESLEWVWQRVKYRKGDEIGAQKGEREIDRVEKPRVVQQREEEKNKERKIS